MTKIIDAWEVRNHQGRSLALFRERSVAESEIIALIPEAEFRNAVIERETGRWLFVSVLCNGAFLGSMRQVRVELAHD